MENIEKKFGPGEIVEHKINGDYLMVLKTGKEQYQCRTKDMREIWFYDFELKSVSKK